ncbi:hypothetical protein [Oceanicoccus sagamiensis]|uniref:Uncharacterized protein n=1 Tax=Oceanicoccus sagamiensis TaxID=716816 RepID=A0A1X9NGF8_9GAMM|nr:hypothetical protein [Oceanicoccus sagamiensis]ARN74589.1 hypothetical protein BST96_10930 [Oceanicoccus sagamiensis]
MIRLNDANFLMLLELTQIVLPAENAKLKQAVVAMHKGSLTTKSSLKKAVTDLSAVVARLDQQLTATAYSDQQTKAVRARLLTQSAKGQYRDFAAAEQAFLAIESITIALNQDADLEKQLNSLYDTLENEDGFSPQTFKSVAAKVKSAFK